MEQHRTGKVTVKAIDEFIDQWHTGVSNECLPIFLGMTQAEYQAWVENPDALLTFG